MKVSNDLRNLFHTRLMVVTKLNPKLPLEIQKYFDDINKAYCLHEMVIVKKVRDNKWFEKHEKACIDFQNRLSDLNPDNIPVKKPIMVHPNVYEEILTDMQFLGYYIDYHYAEKTKMKEQLVKVELRIEDRFHIKPTQSNLEEIEEYCSQSKIEMCKKLQNYLTEIKEKQDSLNAKAAYLFQEYKSNKRNSEMQITAEQEEKELIAKRILTLVENR